VSDLEVQTSEPGTVYEQLYRLDWRDRNGRMRVQHPKDVGRFLDYLASEPVYAEYMTRTENIPAHAGLVKKGIDYKMSPAAKAALEVFVADVQTLTPTAYAIQGYKYNRALFNPTAARLGQAIVGEISFDDAMKRIASDAEEQIKAAQK